MSYHKDFPIFEPNPGLIYLDSASTSQKPAHVIDGVHEYVSSSNANIHRGMYDISQHSARLYSQSKKAIAKYMGTQAKNIVYGANATHLYNTLVHALLRSNRLEQGDVVLMAMWDHHASIVPWQLWQEVYGISVRFFGVDTEGRVDWESFDRAYTSDVRIVQCSMVSNVTGMTFPVEQLSDRLREDTMWIVDGSQALPHMSVNVNDLGCDAFVVTGHKMFAYTGIGAMYCREELLQDLTPGEGGGGIISDVTESGYELAQGVHKREPGTPNMIGAVSLLYACEYIQSLGGYDAIRTYEKKLTLAMLRGFTELSDRVGEGFVLVGAPMEYSNNINDISEKFSHRVPVFSWSLPHTHPVDLNDFLAEQNIAVRCGGHCAHPLLHHYKMKGVCRASLHIYNTMEDIQSFFAALHLFLDRAV